MKIAIVYPPFATLSGVPPTSLSALGTYLRAHGHSPSLIDLNTKLFHYLLDNWNGVRNVFEECFDRRLKQSTGELRRRQVDRLRTLAIPIVQEISDTREHPLLQELIRELTDAYLFDALLADSDDLTACFPVIAEQVERRLNDPLYSKFMSKCSWHNADVIGFSVLSSTQFPYALLHARSIRANKKDAVIIVGGPLITEIHDWLPKECFNYFDYLVIHEGESALLSILDSVGSNNPSNHPNVISRTSKITQSRSIHMEDISFLPPQQFTGIDLEIYKPWNLVLPVYTSKGCTWRQCAFCSRQNDRYRERPMDKVVDELEVNSSVTGCNTIQFVDEEIRPPRFRSLSENIMNREGLTLRWSAQTRFYPTLDKGLLTLMKKAGCYLLEFGLESASQRILDRIRKGISLSEAIRVLRECGELGIRAIVNCMVGFPGESLTDAECTVAYVDRIIEECPRLEVMLNTQFVKVYRNSAFGKWPSCFGITSAIPHQLSPVMSWDKPKWVADFSEKYAGHPILNGEWVGRSNKPEEDGMPSVGNDPRVSLSGSFVLLPAYGDGGGGRKQRHCPATRLVQKNGSRWKVYSLSEPTALIASTLAKKTLRLGDLENEFFSKMEQVALDKSRAEYAKGLLGLNRIGALNYHVL